MFEMYRLLLLLAVVQSALAVTESTLEELINEIFGVETDAADFGNDDVKTPDCISLEGRGVGCYECRFCNDSFVQTNRYQTNKVELLLKNAQCSAQLKLCCVAQRDFLNFRSNDKCGKPNPEGIPRRRRVSVRSMLQAEFPWRAWVYSKGTSTPLCAATFIDEDKKALLTLASCVHGLAPASLEVAFIRGGARATVSRVKEHESYTAEADSNNIAILQLHSLESIPMWAAPACLPCEAPPLVAPCVTTTAADLRIDSVIPLRTECTLDNTSLPEDLTCALAPPGDYEPETAAGLYCLDQNTTPPSYTIHGMFTSESLNIASYINIFHFKQWLNDSLNLKN